MSKIKEVREIVEFLKENPKIAKQLGNLFMGCVNPKEDDYIIKFSGMNDEELKTYIPDIYVKNLSNINYGKLKGSIKLIAFSIGNTLIPLEDRLLISKYVKKSESLIEELKVMGFRIVLVTGSDEKHAEKVCSCLKADGYISTHKKSKKYGFHTLMKEYGSDLSKEQVLFIGSSMIKHIKCANDYGFNTALIRPISKATFAGRLVKKSEGYYLRLELEKRGLWYEHNQNTPGDQYYQCNGCRGIKNHIIPNNNFLKSIGVENADNLRKYWSDSIVFTDAVTSDSDKYEIAVEDYFQGEIMAVEYNVGYYVVRQSVRLYKSDEKTPASDEQIALTSQKLKVSDELFEQELIAFFEISAKNVAKQNDDYIFVCKDYLPIGRAETGHNISCICTAKSNPNDNDENASLLVLSSYSGNLYNSDTWYKLDYDGTVKKLVLEFPDDSAEQPQFN